MISMKEYLGGYSKSKDLTPVRLANIQRLLKAVNTLMAEAISDGVLMHENPATRSQVSGVKDGGFRPQDCPTGAPGSAHKEGLAVDIYDPEGIIGVWLLKSPVAQKKYEALGLYFEHPSTTKTWSHWSLRRPTSGKRFFIP